MLVLHVYILSKMDEPQLGGCMQDKKISVFSGGEKQTAANLMLIGMPRKLANVLVFLIQRSGTAREIEIATEMRQPEVSVALSDLSEWIHVTKSKSDRSARVIAYYELSVPFYEVIEHYYLKYNNHRVQVDTAYSNLRGMSGAM